MIPRADHAVSVQLESPQVSGLPFGTAQLCARHVETALVLAWLQLVCPEPVDGGVDMKWFN
jgi:hypothetical protein